MVQFFRWVLGIGLSLMSAMAISQETIPYYNNFDAPNDTSGWSHYAISGIDDWEAGPPTNGAFSPANCFVTGLDGSFEGNSNRVLETPVFDLSNTLVDYSLSFYHKRQAVVANNYYYLEYSLDDGISWSMLDNASTQKKNWQSASGFSNNFYSSYQHSAINLGFLQGNSQVTFRFRFQSGAANGQGWMIDNFSIAEETYNITAYPGDYIFIAQNCLQFNVSSLFGFYNQYSDPFYNATNFYFSNDPLLDVQDVLLETNYVNTAVSIENYENEIVLANELNVGEYYILYQHDALDSLVESNEFDNVGYAVLHVDTVLNMPYIEDFEGTGFPWKVISPDPDFIPVWEKGSGYRHHIEGAHSGDFAWHTGKTMYFNDDTNTSNSNIQYIESPSIDLASDTGDIVMNLWFKNEIEANVYHVEHKLACGEFWSTLFTFPAEAEDEWDFFNEDLAPLIPYSTAKFRVKFTSSYLNPEGLIFDDVYVGRSKPDLTIERDKSDRFTATSTPDLDLKYYFFNSGTEDVVEAITTFYWSTDNVLDAGDQLLGTKTENNISAESRFWTSFVLTKPTATIGTYYIFYVLDEALLVDEMRENNNMGYFTLYQQDIMALPYFNDFEVDVNNWRHDATLGSDDWFHGIPQGQIAGMAFSGEKAWISADTGYVTPMSRMHLYTPVFDLTTLQNPVMEFDMLHPLHDNCLCSRAELNMSYSVDGGATWQVLDTTNNSYNRWYYPIEYESGVDQNYYLANSSYLMFDTGEKSFVTADQYNSRDASRNTRYIIDLAFLHEYTAVQFRYNMAADFVDASYTNTKLDGVLIDNFSIGESYVDLLVEYQKHLMISSLSNQLRFFMHVKNQGNYISNPATIQYYLSSDATLDDGDFALGQFELTAIRPDLNRYVNVAFDGPTNLLDYQYLMYELDIANTNVESDEINNIGFWPLSLDSISVYPYVNHFQDTVVNGWHQYAVGPFDDNIIRYRWRNMTAPAEVLYQSAITSGQWFTEPVASGNLSYRPTFYLESPAFDFTGLGQIDLSFVLMCIGRTFQQIDGGNLQYSVDGGNSWSVVEDEYDTAQNWYEYNNMSELDNEPGWSGPPLSNGVPDFDTTHIDVSYLGGEPNVVFRFKYRSNHYYYGEGNVQGMRVDDFSIEALSLDYVANVIMEPVELSMTNTTVELNYSISCTGDTGGLSSTTTFYWSLDDVLDGNDVLIHTIDELPIANGSTLDAMALINYPTPLTQAVYHVFYVADGEFEIGETNENNNVGSFVITFTDYDAVEESDDNGGLFMSTSNGNLILRSESETLNGPFTLEIFDAKGGCVWKTGVVIGSGSQIIQLPNAMSAGLYQIHLYNENSEVTKQLYLAK